jgi:plastocyanin
MMMRAIRTTALVVAFAAGAAAAADGVTVFQEGRKFSEPEVTLKRGASVTFTNKDAFTHNVYSTTPGMAFDLKTQKPGQSTEVTFDKAGVADVLCAIHPQMKMKVVVTE